MRRTTTRSPTARGASALIAIAAALVACGGGSPPCGPRADHSVIACFDEQPVTAAEVGEHLRADEPDARGTALADALKVRVFAAEAVRRKLAGGDGRDARSRAVLHQALVRDEAARAGALPDQIPAEQVRALYEARPGLFNKITSVWVRGLFTDSREAAVAAQQRAQGLDDAGFAAAGGQDLGEAHADGVDPALRRAANDLRKEGELSGPVQLADGRWVVLRATRVEMTVRPLAEAEHDERNHLARMHERVALEKLYHSVGDRHRIRIFAEELAHLPAPLARP